MAFKSKTKGSYRPLQFYTIAEKKQEKPVGVFKVYYRKADNTLGEMHASDDYSHKEAILTVKEALVAGGDDIHQKAILAVIQGGKSE